MSFLLNFLHGAEGVAQGVAQPFETLGKGLLNAPAAVGREIQNKPITDIQQNTFGTTNQGQIAKKIIGSTAGAELTLAAPAVSKGVDAALPGLSDVAGNFGSKVANSAITGGALGGSFNVASQAANNSNVKPSQYTLDFLEGTGAGLGLGAVGGAAGEAIAHPLQTAGAVKNQADMIGRPYRMNNQEVVAVGKYARSISGQGNVTDAESQAARNALVRNKIDPSDPEAVNKVTLDFAQHNVQQRMSQTGAIGNNVSGASNLFSQEDLGKLSKANNVSSISKQLETHLGPVLAERIAPAIAQAKDPNVIANIIDNSLKQHLPSPTPLQPSENSVTPSTPLMRDVQPGQGSANLTDEQPFINSPTSTGGPARVSELGAAQGMKDILNNGGTVDEALNHHMETMGSNYGEASQALNKLVNGPTAKLDKGGINASLNPKTDTVSVPHADSNEQAIKNSRLIRNQVIRTGNTALDEVRKLSPNDLKLMDNLRGSTPQALADQAEDKTQFLKAASATKDYNDLTQATGHAFGQQVPYRQNYGAPLLFDQSEEGQQALQNVKAKLPTTPGYGRGRTLQSYEEGAQFGLKRQNPDFAGDLEQDIDRRSSGLAQLTLAKGLDESNPGQIKVINSEDIPYNYKQLQIPGGNKLFAPSEVADDINKRAPAPQAGGILKGYDALNSAGKNLKLAGGGFHSVNVLGSYLGQQLASGKAFTARGLSDFGNVIKGTFSDNAYKSTITDMNSRGKLLDADASGLKYGTGETAADINPTGKLGNIPVLKQIHSAIFDRQIPLLKLKIFDQQTEGLDRNNPDDLKQMSSVAKELNQNFGGINREIQGLTPRQFSIAARGFLATDYNEGQIRSLVDAFSKGGTEGKLARQVVFGKALLFGGLATAGAAAGGEFQGQNPHQVALDIFNKTINPSFKMGGYKVGLPTTQIAEVAKPIEQSVQGAQNGNPAQGIENFASSRLAAVPSLAEQLGTNKNFAGQPIYGTDTHGRPIPTGTTTANVLSQIVPIPASQTVQTATGNQSIGAAIANTVGLRATPQESSQSLPVAQQTYLDQLKQSGADKNQINASNDFFGAIKQLSKSKTSTSNEIDQDLAKGDLSDAQKAAATYNQQLIKSLKPIVTKNPNILTDQLEQQLQGSIIDLSDSSVSSRLQAILSNPRKYGIKTPPLGATSVP